MKVSATAYLVRGAAHLSAHVVIDELPEDRDACGWSGIVGVMLICACSFTRSETDLRHAGHTVTIAQLHDCEQILGKLWKRRAPAQYRFPDARARNRRASPARGAPC